MKFAAPALAAMAMIVLTACDPQPVVTGTNSGGVPVGPYFLVGIGADAVPERDATLVIAEGGITGTGPCNSFNATNSAAPPAFAVSNFNSTRAGCQKSGFENRYFTALQQATEVEYSGGLLIVKGPTWLQFEAGYPAEK